MSIKSFSDMNEIHIDVLKEIANIGSSNAAASLSKMLGHPIKINVPEISIKGFNDACEVLGGAEAVMVGAMLTISNGLDGMIMYLLPTEIACNLVNILCHTDIKTYEEIDEMGFSAIQEIANIMSGTFVSAISTMTDLKIDISPPAATVDMLASIMSVPSIYFAAVSDTIMLMRTQLELSGKTANASIMMMPDIPSLDKLMTRLGIEMP